MGSCFSEDMSLSWMLVKFAGFVVMSAIFSVIFWWAHNWMTVCTKKGKKRK